MQSRTLSLTALRAPAAAAATWPAETLALGIILVGSTFMRLVRLSGSSGDLDEGIRGMQLLLMTAGFRPVREIYSSQGPLLLDMLYPLYSLFGETLGAARLAVGVYSLVGILGAFWVARLVGGPLGGVAAASLLALSPTYLRNSRQALAEVPALAPAILAIGAALAFQRSGRHAWLVLSGVLLGVALLVKPIVAAAVLPVALAAVLGRRRGLGPLLLVGLTTALVVAGVILSTDLQAVLNQMVDYRLKSREASGWNPRENWKLLQETLGRDGIGLFALAGGSGLALLLDSPRRALPLVAWAGLSLGLLLAYAPLFPKHAAVLLPPVAILAGAGIGRVWQAVRAARWQGMVGVLALAGPALLYLWSAPAVLSWDARFMNLGPSTEGERFPESADAAAAIAGLTQPADFVVTDNPELPFLARRLVPPELADPSRTRVRARELTGEEIAQAGDAYDAKLVVLWGDRLRGLRAFTTWLDERFQPAKVYSRGGNAPRVVYLRRDHADSSQARAALATTTREGAIRTTASADFGGILRLHGWGLDRAEMTQAGNLGVTYEWEGLGRASVDYHILTELRGPDGQVWADEELSLGSRNVGLTEWQPGRWLFQTSIFKLPDTAPLGEYTATVGVLDTRARSERHITAGDERLGSRVDPLYRFELGTIQVR